MSLMKSTFRSWRGRSWSTWRALSDRGAGSGSGGAGGAGSNEGFSEPSSSALVVILLEDI